MNGMLALSVSVADTAGTVILQMTGDYDPRGGSRRVTRTKTLDGACAIFDGGFSHSDRTWQVVAWADETTWEKLFALMSLYSLVNVATGEGFFTACIEAAAREEDKVRMTILIKEKIA